MCNKFDIIAFDADDTLWHNEVFYLQGRDFFAQLLADYVEGDLAGNTLDQIETNNVRFYGYGIKSFILSMVEAAIQLTSGQMEEGMIAEIIDYAKQMIVADPVHFSNTREVLASLKENHATT